MVSADNLNLDVLEEIFSYLPHGPTLASVALVSRSFLEAVVPRLYESISFRIRQAKSYPEVMTPFGAIIARPDLAAYIRNVEIFAIPQIQKANRLINHPAFIRECTAALKLCHNLRSLKTTVAGAVTYLFPSISDKTLLERLCLYANLTMQQSESLLMLPNIKALEIQSGSWSVADILPKWIQASLHQSLRHLTLYMITDLNEDVLEAALVQLPELSGLHVMACPKVDHNCVLRVTRHTPLLESLSMTTSDINKINSLIPCELSCIRNLALDSRSADLQEILSAIFQYLRTNYFPLTSFKLKAPQKKAVLPFDFVKSLAETHGHSLRRLSFLDCEVQMNSIEQMCKNCPKIERIDLALPMKELGSFGKAISHAKNLRTIVDVDNHVQHGARTYLTSDNIEFFMTFAPNLKTIIDGNRIWTRKREQSHIPSVSLERRQTRKAGTHWFVPQEA
ncbi:hypothetical protein P691DRAFT_695009 [Macrolepiota fuliginosa MF-IS2]|uniref:F-box domain-containing protein n=1 Tax=Macrolepiota fuliginosa MF-IS2 TaxID=1400762 RepID=A0A9P5XMR3_9AGAR|nr:hypothetical protein P691DRAFT_695009 [Macrolepiota fuliginosa MF-IS2]